MSVNNKIRYALSFRFGEIFPTEMSPDGIDLFQTIIVCFDKKHLLKTMNKNIKDLKKFIIDYFENVEGIKQ